jgi:hypothetical protein
MAFYRYVVFVDGVPTTTILASPAFKKEIAWRALKKMGFSEKVWPLVTCRPFGQCQKQQIEIAARA